MGDMAHHEQQAGAVFLGRTARLLPSGPGQACTVAVPLTSLAPAPGHCGLVSDLLRGVGCCRFAELSRALSKMTCRYPKTPEKLPQAETRTEPQPLGFRVNLAKTLPSLTLNMVLSVKGDAFPKTSISSSLIVEGSLFSLKVFRRKNVNAELFRKAT